MLKPFLSIGFRPFFTLMAALAVITIGQWVVYFNYNWPVLFVRGNPVLWHSHEMLFGFACAAIAAFLLTASANWVQQPPKQGAILVALSGAWILGRLAMMFSSFLNPWLVALLDLSFLALLIAVIGHVLISAGNQRNYKLLLVLAVLLLMNALYHAESIGIATTASAAIRVALIAIIVLISVIGGRIIPAFTGNWLRQQNKAAETGLPKTSDTLDAITIGATIAFAAVWGVLPNAALTGLIAIFASIAHVIRLSRWKGLATVSEPLMLSLHCAYAWIAVSLMTLGISLSFSGLPVSAGIHALTVGGVGTMIIAVAARVSLGHTGRPLASTKLVSMALLLVTAAAVLRTIAPISDHYSEFLLMSGLCWMLAFMLFLVEFFPKYIKPRVP